jgi:hypothetical protein
MKIRKGQYTLDTTAITPWDHVAVLAAGAAHGRTLAARAAEHGGDAAAAAGILAARLSVLAATVEYAVVARCDDAVVAALCEGVPRHALDALDALDALARGPR